jgi:hypothetical protein
MLDSNSNSQSNDDTSGSAELSSSLTLKDYLGTAANASRQTRFITIILVVVSALVGVSVLNSSDLGWITLRINALQQRTASPYTARKFPLLCRCDVQVSDESSACKDEEVRQKPAFEKIDEIERMISYTNNVRVRMEDDLFEITNDPNAQAVAQLKTKQKALEETRQTLGDWEAKKTAICDGETYRWKTFFEAMTKTAAENKYTVHVPFFGIAFDVNDIGILGGFSLWIVLILLRLSLRSQIVSLRIGFKEAFERNEERYFYEILAAQQVFVFPPLRHDKQRVSVSQGWIEQWWRRSSLGKLYQRGRVTLLRSSNRLRDWMLATLKIRNTARQDTLGDDLDVWQANRNVALRVVPKGLSLLPFVIYALQFKFDLDTTHYGVELSPYRTQLLIIAGTFFIVNIFVFGVWCTTKWNELDRLWDYYDDHIRSGSKLGQVDNEQR